MRFSRSFPASNHCLPSPDGEFVATLTLSDIIVRLVRTLRVVNAIKLPQDLPRPVISFKWSPSSQYVAITTVEQIHVFSAPEGSNFHAVVRNPSPPATKPGYVEFGPNQRELCMTSSLGLKFSIFDLASSRTVEIGNPKFYNASTACNGFSFRPHTGHLAVLTRTLGKDVVSIHQPASRECQKTWHPDTVDAHGLEWSPDGRWLVVWESAAHGHKVLFYTPDGHIFKAWNGPQVQRQQRQQQHQQHQQEHQQQFPLHQTHQSQLDAADSAATRECGYFGDLAAGVKLLRFATNGKHLAIADFSQRVFVLEMTTMSEAMRLSHPSSIVPRDTLQVWQQQAAPFSAGALSHGFIKATQTISPTTRSAGDNSELKMGCSFMLFDCSSALLATILGDCPGTVWVWDIQAAELRAVLLFHGSVTNISWHLRLGETLLISCHGDQQAAAAGLAFVWDSMSDGPRTVDFSQQPAHADPKDTGTVAGSVAGVDPSRPRKLQTMWLNNRGSESPAVFFSDAAHYTLASLAGSDDDESVPWRDETGEGRITAKESALELISAASTGGGEQLDDDDDDGGGSTDSDLEDTFHFKRQV